MTASTNATTMYIRKLSTCDSHYKAYDWLRLIYTRKTFAKQKVVMRNFSSSEICVIIGEKTVKPQAGLIIISTVSEHRDELQWKVGLNNADNSQTNF